MNLINYAMTGQRLPNFIDYSEKRLERILDRVSQVTGVPVAVIVSRDRHNLVKLSRHLYMVAAFRQYEGQITVIKIARAVNRHHATLLHAVKYFSRIENLPDEKSREEMELLEKVLLYK